MKWIQDYQLFLLDFDGLLVDTESIHYAAYIAMCKEEGFDLPWDFPTYCSYAHLSATGIRDGIFALFPDMQAREPNWDVHYQRKRYYYSKLLEEKGVQLMPKVRDFLFALAEADVKRCVVTHSADIHVMPIRDQHEALKSIPHWIMRDDYERPKPDPQCYEVAIERLAEPSDRVIGLEDTPRGLTALSATRAQPVWVTEVDYPDFQAPRADTVRVSNLEALLETETLPLPEHSKGPSQS